MSISGDQMELREEEIRAHYDAAMAMLDGFDHTPRIAAPVETPKAEKSSGIGTRRRFRTTTPGLVGRSTARPEGVQILEGSEVWEASHILEASVILEASEISEASCILEASHILEASEIWEASEILEASVCLPSEISECARACC